jgi:flagellar biosynthesis/type III secretory pathway chaperone
MEENQLIEIFQNQLELFKKLFDCTQDTAQKGLDGKDLNEWESFLAARERILNQIRRCQRKTARLPLPRSKREALDDVCEEIRSLHQKITILDQKIIQILQAEKLKVYEMMKKFHHGHLTLKGYSPQRTQIPRYCDIKG